MNQPKDRDEQILAARRQTQSSKIKHQEKRQPTKTVNMRLESLEDGRSNIDMSCSGSK